VRVHVAAAARLLDDADEMDGGVATGGGLGERVAVGVVEDRDLDAEIAFDRRRPRTKLTF